MQDWKQVEKRIRELDSQHEGILKCQGNDRRKIISNDGKTIRMYVGKNNTKPSKPITYNMIKYAFNRLRAGCVFDAPYFLMCYDQEYRNGPCRYSMVGGVLVELKLADRFPKGGRSCYYTQGKGLY